MPTYGNYDVGHWATCQPIIRFPRSKDCPYHCRIWNGQCRKCPLDGIGEWHDRHENPGVLSEEYERITVINKDCQIGKDPDPEACKGWVKGVLARFGLNNETFAQFFGEVQVVLGRQREQGAAVVSIARDELYLCWTAHLWADYVYPYWNVANYRPWTKLGDAANESYTDMPKPLQKALGDYARQIISRVVAEECGWRSPAEGARPSRPDARTA